MLVPMEVRRGCQIHRSCSYKKSWAASMSFGNCLYIFKEQKALLAARQSFPPYNILFTNTDIKTENSVSWLRNFQFKYSRSFFPKQKTCMHTHVPTTMLRLSGNNTVLGLSAQVFCELSRSKHGINISLSVLPSSTTVFSGFLLCTWGNPHC